MSMSITLEYHWIHRVKTWLAQTQPKGLVQMKTLGRSGEVKNRLDDS